MLGTEKGLVEYNISSRKEKIIKNFSNFHSFKDYRSNDGGFCDEKILLGFMHRKNAEKIPGYIYIVKKNEISLLDNEIHVPNSFIQISKRKILISDSLKKEIWSYSIDHVTGDFSKELWAKIDSPAVPDGGCIINGLIFIALWDDASIGIFSSEGDLLRKVDVPAKRPTNWKYHPISSKLWVTSAREDLSINQIKTYPSSGDTFIYNLQF